MPPGGQNAKEFVKDTLCHTTEHKLIIHQPNSAVWHGPQKDYGNKTSVNALRLHQISNNFRPLPLDLQDLFKLLPLRNLVNQEAVAEQLPTAVIEKTWIFEGCLAFGSSCSSIDWRSHWHWRICHYTVRKVCVIEIRSCTWW
jgi:hypothetical protein